MDIVSFTPPIEQSYAQEGLETALQDAFIKVFASELQSSMQDLVDYGCPQIGSNTVVERFAKQDGLVALRGGQASDKTMQIILANWLSLASERGIRFMEFVLTMLWRDQWSITRLWHSISKVNQYPAYLSETAQSGYFLTSRMNLVLEDTIALKEIMELVPTVRRLVPAHIVLNVIAESLNKDFGSTEIGLAVAGKAINVIDLS